MVWLGFLDNLFDPMDELMQTIRFWLVIANLCWILPLAVRSITRPRDKGFPNAGLAIPLAGILIGIAGFSAMVVYDFEPSRNWGSLLSAFISLNLVVMFAMGIARWRGVDL